MAFSNDGQYLLSVSRDRSWSLFEIDETSTSFLSYASVLDHFFPLLDFQARLYKRISSNNPHHKRIIWTCSFSHDDKYFVTGARDQLVHVWRVKEKSADDNEQPCEKNPLKLTDSVTAVACAARFIDNDKSVNALPLSLSVKESLVPWKTLDISWLPVSTTALFFSTPGMSKSLGSSSRRSHLRKKRKPCVENYSSSVSD
jgi:WD40 repeat protein